MVIEWFTLNNHQSCHCKISRVIRCDWLVHLFYRGISLNVFMIASVFYTKDSVCPSLVLTCLLHNERMRALILGDCRCFSWMLHLTLLYKIGVNVNMKSKLIQFTSYLSCLCHLGQKIMLCYGQHSLIRKKS